MTAEQFTWWVQGFLDAKPFSSEVAEKIQEKLKEVKHEAKSTTNNHHYWPNYKDYRIPYNWSSNTVQLKDNQMQPVPDGLTITC